MLLLRCFAALALGSCLMAGDDPRSLEAHPGKTPVLDGVISPGEWDDATVFSGVEGWKPQFSAVTGTQDLSLKGYVKHDGKRLYFAFDVTDDVLYGIDTPRWLPSNNPKAHELTREGFPWFGDEIEVLINASNHWTGNQDSAGNGSSWQMVCNLTKSRKGGDRRRRPAGRRTAPQCGRLADSIRSGFSRARRSAPPNPNPEARATSSNGR